MDGMDGIGWMGLDGWDWINGIGWMRLDGWDGHHRSMVF